MNIRLKFRPLLNSEKSFQAYIKTCVCVLKNLAKNYLITEGTVLHGHFIKIGVSSERFIALKLLILYLNCKKSDEANEIEKGYHGFDLVVQNCLLFANVKWGNFGEARRLFDQMPRRNDISWTAMISGLMKHGRVEESMWYFERNPFHSVVSWTAMICGLVQNQLNFEAVKFFLKLLESGVRPNDVTYTSVITACAGLNKAGLGMSILGLIIRSGFSHYLSISNSLIALYSKIGDVDKAREIFDLMEARDVVSWTSILDAYAETGDLREARRIFDEMPERNEVSWSAMIARYSQYGYATEAFKLFSQMIRDGLKPNISCLSSVLSSLTALVALQAGMNIHGHVIAVGIERNVFIASCLIDLYSKCGKLESGFLVFDSVSPKNMVMWNSMIGGYCLNGRMEEAMVLFRQTLEINAITWNTVMAGFVENKRFDEVFEVFYEMILSGENPCKSTFSSVLCACASIASLERGKNFHGKIIKHGVCHDVFVGTALVDMYAKSGDIESSKQVFSQMPEKNEISWTAMIQGLAENGLSEESLSLFEEMKRTSSAAPNEFMLLAVIFACSHSGLIDKGVEYFFSMESVYGIRPKGRHYTCVVDLLSRSGRLVEAEEFINSMPFEPEANALAALLSGCNVFKNEEIAERTAMKLWEMSEKNSAGYVLLSNIYASSGRWINVSGIRKLMRDRKLKKIGGCSWVEIRNQIHPFYSEDGNHSHSTEIYRLLELIHYDMVIL